MSLYISQCLHSTSSVCSKNIETLCFVCICFAVCVCVVVFFSLHIRIFVKIVDITMHDVFDVRCGCYFKSNHFRVSHLPPVGALF